MRVAHRSHKHAGAGACCPGIRIAFGCAQEARWSCGRWMLEMRGGAWPPTNPGFVCRERHQRQPPDSSEIQLHDIAVRESRRTRHRVRSGDVMKFMNPSAVRILAMSLVAAAAMAMSTSSLAANYSLELVSPRAAGTTPSSGSDAISAQNRIFRAYPGIAYNIRAVVVGGAYPFTFTLGNAPAGMTIDAATGEVN